jgi:hypothetical protein
VVRPASGLIARCIRFAASSVAFASAFAAEIHFFAALTSHLPTTDAS